MNNRYIVAFNRDRDFYQVPLALAEIDRLELFLTDFYLSARMARSKIAAKLGIQHRFCAGLPFKRVMWSGKALRLQLVNLRFARNQAAKTLLFRELDAGLSRLAGREALRNHAGLFVYSGYALEAFQLVHGHEIDRKLFVYHPNGSFVKAILDEDFEKHPEIAESHSSHMAEIQINEGERVTTELELADGIACASTFTRKSVEYALKSQCKSIRVVPYGCFPQPSGEDIPTTGRDSTRPRVLFVGQGTQRKGLHHLIKALARGLYRMADLTLVVNNLDQGIRKLIDSLPVSPRVLTKLSRAKLDEEFQRAHIFVLPSLVEGFGLVYLEAMSAGCHVIGTGNTGLPDLHAPSDVASIIPAGDVDVLEKQLLTCIRQVQQRQINHDAIRAFASTRSWGIFRQGIQSFISTP